MYRRAFLALSLLSPASYAASILYSYQDLGTLPFAVRALNARGWMAGETFNEPYRYRPGIGSERLASDGSLFDINDAGTAVGIRFRGGLWMASSRPDGGEWTDLGSRGSESHAVAINEAGTITGYSHIAGGAHRAFVYTAAEGMKVLGTLGGSYSRALDINEAGHILGLSETAAGEVHTFLYREDTGMVDIQDAIGDPTFQAVELSDNGIILGMYGGGHSSRTAVYSPSLGYRKIGTLGGKYVIPRDINDRGWSVGYYELPGPEYTQSAFLYVYGQGIQDLNTLVPGLGVRLKYAQAINDRDQIVAYGENGHTYLLSRVHATSRAAATPEPATWLLLGAGLATMMARRRSAR